MGVDTADDDALFGRWLRRRRKALDLTQKELARRVGCSPATIRKLEAEERRPSRHVAAALAGALGVRTALGILDRSRERVATPTSDAAWDEARGIAAAVRGAYDEAATRLLHAADRWRRASYPLEEARAASDAARALARCGRSGEAEAARGRAERLLRSLQDQLPSDELRTSFSAAATAMLDGSSAVL